MIDMIGTILDLINAQLGHQTAVRALLPGFGLAIAVPQLLKFLPHLDRLSDRTFRRGVRCMSFGIGALFTWMLWPEPGWVGAMMGCLVGLVAPIAYKVGIVVLQKYWPTMADALSARPGTDGGDSCSSS